ncbi:MAG: histidine phosphatase family protein [Deltaproteobacteria bacterium]|nr:histidine phosphatase family protein [Deltaproteobacteria bacterium]MCF8119759.1 histidine phosphatase family protein [Deltaproteobacteria bacterium]
MIRHGQVNGYQDFVVYGHTDVDLTEIGMLQMKQMAERLRLTNLKVIYASDLKRASTGAKLIAMYHDVPVRVLPELREMAFGDWEGLPLAEIRHRFPEALTQREADLINFRVPGGGESVGDLGERICQAFDEIREREKGKDIALVVHGAVNRVILCQAMGLDLSCMFNIQQDYGCLNIIDYYPDKTLVRLVNG